MDFIKTPVRLLLSNGAGVFLLHKLRAVLVFGCASVAVSFTFLYTGQPTNRCPILPALFLANLRVPVGRPKFNWEMTLTDKSKVFTLPALAMRRNTRF